MDMNKWTIREIVGLIKVSKHVGWGILNHHVLHAHKVMWPLEWHGVAMSRRTYREQPTLLARCG